MTLETANREQVGRALDLARDGLRPFVERHLRRTRGGLGQIPAILRDTPYEEKADPLSDIAVIVMVVRAAWETLRSEIKRSIWSEFRNGVEEIKGVRERVRHLDPRPPRSRSGDPAAALATRYRHDPRLENVGRGMYALRGARAVPASPSAASPRKPRGRGRSRSRYTFARPVAYTLFGARHEVRTFRDVLLGVCATLHERAPAEFERVLELRGRVRPYFSRNPDDLHEAVQVARSGIFVEVNLSASNIVERCEQVIELCGFDPREFGVETR